MHNTEKERYTRFLRENPIRKKPQGGEEFTIIRRLYTRVLVLGLAESNRIAKVY